jgi:hypothetical protein
MASVTQTGRLMHLAFRYSIVTIALMCVPIIGIGQSLPSVHNQNPVYSSPEYLVKILMSDDDDLRERTIAADNNLTGICEMEDQLQVSLLSATLVKETLSRILVVKGPNLTSCETMNIVPMIKQGETWITLGHINFMPKMFYYPRYRVASLISPGEQEIVVSNQMVDEGTGILQNNMTIYKVIENEIKVIFDAPEYLHIAEPHFTDDQISKYFIQADNLKASGPKYIDEERVERINGRRFTSYRRYVWENELQTFRMEGSTPP